MKKELGMYFLVLASSCIIADGLQKTCYYKACLNLYYTNSGNAHM
jgi:hypothetical protein